MERLTIPDEHIDGGIRRALIDAKEVRKYAMTIYWRLKKYEDTGITPDQFQVIEEEYSKMAKELAELRQQNQWIPVSERLPEPGIYLVTCDDKDYPVKRMRMKGICFYDHNGIYDGKVLAWMLLPEPYKE